MKDELSCRRAGVNFFGQRLEIDTEVIHQRGEPKIIAHSIQTDYAQKQKKGSKHDTEISQTGGGRLDAEGSGFTVIYEVAGPVRPPRMGKASNY